MKISLKWLEDYIETNLDVNQTSDALTSLGLECNIELNGLSFSNVVLGKVLNVESHTDSDHLKICTVDIGEKELLQIICGANNVKSKIFVPVAKILPSRETNFLTNAPPIPPVAPVIKIFFPLKLIINIYFFYIFLRIN